MSFLQVMANSRALGEDNPCVHSWEGAVACGPVCIAEARAARSFWSCTICCPTMR